MRTPCQGHQNETIILKRNKRLLYCSTPTHISGEGGNDSNTGSRQRGRKHHPCLVLCLTKNRLPRIDCPFLTTGYIFSFYAVCLSFYISVRLYHCLTVFVHVSLSDCGLRWASLKTASASWGPSVYIIIIIIILHVCITVCMFMFLSVSLTDSLSDCLSIW